MSYKYNPFTGTLDYYETATIKNNVNYYTKSELDGGQLNNQYYTETEMDTTKTNFIDPPLSSQVLTGLILSSGTNVGTGKVSAGTALLRISDSELGTLEWFSIDEYDNIAITTSNIIYTVVLQYNGGSPQIILQEAEPNGTTDISIGEFIIDDSNTVHYLNCGYRFSSGVNKLHYRLEEIRPWEMCKSLTITDEGSKQFSISSGCLFRGINSFNFPKFDTSATDVFTYIYYNGTDWVYVTDQTEIDVDNYNDISTGLATCNKYKCDWVFLHPDDGHVYVVYGQDNVTLASVVASTIPSGLPDLVDIFGPLIGRIIIHGGIATFEEIEMIQTTTFNPTIITNHNDLSNLQGGAIDEYYHLTLSRHTSLTNGDNCSIHKHDDRYYTETEVDTISGSLNDKITTTVNAIPAIDYSADGPQCNTINAGEYITIMDCVYLKSDGEWWKTSASGKTTGAGMLALSLESKNNGQSMNVALPGCFIMNSSWSWIVGGELYLSCTAGDLTQTAVSGTGNVVRIVGHATHSNRMFFNPEQTIIVHD